MPTANFVVARTGPETASVRGDYETAFQVMRVVLEQFGGTIRKESLAGGYIEASFRYEVNPWRLRVRTQFRDIGGGSYEVRVIGHFEDSIDSTGAARERAIDVLDKFASEHPAESPPAHSVTPPKLSPSTSQHRDKKAAALFALFLGGLGAHKFYLGSWGWGIVFLAVVFLFPTPLAFIPAFIPAVVAFFEAIGFFFMSSTEFDAQYNLAPDTPMKW